MPGQGSGAVAAGSAAPSTRSAGGTGIMPPGHAGATPNTTQQAASKPTPQAAYRSTPQLPDRWFVKTGTGDEYGPVTKAELDTWLTEDRLDDDCQLLQEGWEQWKWASDVYPSLAGTSSQQVNPSSQQVATPQPAPRQSFGMDTREASTGFNFGQAYESPAVNSGGYSSTGSSGDSIPSGAVRMFAESSVWMLITAIGITVFLVFMGLGLLFMLVALADAPQGLRGPVLMVFVVNLISFSLMTWVTTMLYGYVGALNRFTRDPSSGSIQQLARKHKAYWFACGIIVLIGLVLFVLYILFIGAVAGGAVGGFARGRF
jgi:hypothetical protein